MAQGGHIPIVLQFDFGITDIVRPITSSAKKPTNLSVIALQSGMASGTPSV